MRGFLPPRVLLGFTLLEVLIAMLIFSMGLLGLGGILVVAVKTNHAATQRTQATFLAQSLADRMRANPIGVWNSNYNVTLPPAAAVACNPTAAAGCNSSGLASWDLSLWWDQVTQSLPAPTSTIRCTQTPVFAPTTLLGRPPYQGSCEIQLSWNEAVQTGTRGSTGAANTSGQQSFSWVFTP